MLRAGEWEQVTPASASWRYLHFGMRAGTFARRARGPLTGGRLSEGDLAAGARATETALSVAIGYLLGSMPWGYWLPRLARGKDVRASGSGGTGAANVWRTAGFKLGVAVAALDVAKGFAAASVGLSLGGEGAGVAAGVAAMAGHWRPLFLGLRRGGKAVATTGGVAVALAPFAALCAAGVWVVAFLLGRYSSVASLAGALSLPLFAWAFGGSWTIVGFTAAAAAAIVVLHRSNIARLLAHEENRFDLSRR